MRVKIWILAFVGLAMLASLPQNGFALDTDTASPFGFGLGPRAGYIQSENADRGNWTAGVQARLRLLPMLAIEGAVDYHEQDFANGAARVSNYPVTLSALLYIWPLGPIQPYIVGGVGWYYTTVDYRGPLAGQSSTTSNQFGYHAGGGLDLALSKMVTLDADIRYIFLNLPSELKDRAARDIDANGWMVTVGLTFYVF